MKTTILLLLGTFMFGITVAQKSFTKDYDWEKNPVLHTLSEDDQKLPELILKEKIIKEFAYNAKDEFEAYWLRHVIIRVNSDDAINANNKIYLPYSNENDLIRQKVRVINSKGKVITLSSKDIKESVDEETETTLKYFALEGIDMGSEIEYYFLMRSSTNLFGSRITLQASDPKQNLEFTLVTPWNIVLEAKCYNGLPELEMDTTSEDHNILHLSMDEMPGLEDEDFANRDANLQYLVYKIKMNRANNKRDIVRYSQYAENVFSSFYTDLSTSTGKKIQKFIKELNVEDLNNDEEKIRALEHFIKTKIQIYEFNVDELSDLSFIVDKKAANEFGLTKLYTHLFTEFDIEHQLVVTSNRYDAKFDAEFEGYNFLETYLIYFPKIKKYMEPANQMTRLGYISTAYQHNNAIFIVPVVVGDFKSAVAKPKFIDALPHEATKDDLLIEVDLNKNILNPEYSIHREQMGYYAQSSQIIYSYLDEEGQKNVSESQILFISENAEIKEVKLTNTGGENFGVKPLITEGKFETSEFVEKAGTKYLFNIGLLIGPQAEMYEDTDRKLDVENDFNRWYHRVIRVELPEGYKCSNLNDLTMDVYQEKNGERTMTFTSNYTLKGNSLEVVIDEYYSQIFWPVTEYEDYRNVINAAADFNKISLILEAE